MQQPIHKFAAIIYDAFAKKRNIIYAEQMQKYMRNQFIFFGIKTEERRNLLQLIIKKNTFPDYKDYLELANLLLEYDEREMNYAVIDLATNYKKVWDNQMLKLQNIIAYKKPWWDTVDASNSFIFKPFYKQNKNALEQLVLWNNSENIWIVRLSIIGQLGQKQKTDVALLSNNILKHNGSNEFFIQKAIGWALRDYASYDPHWVKNFANNYELKPLSKREALRKIK